MRIMLIGIFIVVSLEYLNIENDLLFLIGFICFIIGLISSLIVEFTIKKGYSNEHKI